MNMIFYLSATTHLHHPYIPPKRSRPFISKKWWVLAVEVEVIARAGDMCV